MTVSVRNNFKQIFIILNIILVDQTLFLCLLLALLLYVQYLKVKFLSEETHPPLNKPD